MSASISTQPILSHFISQSPRGLHRMYGAAGIKWNFTGTALLTANLLMAVNDAGLRDRLTPVIGLDWGF